MTQQQQQAAPTGPPGHPFCPPE